MSTDAVLCAGGGLDCADALRSASGVQRSTDALLCADAGLDRAGALLSLVRQCGFGVRWRTFVR